MEKATLPISLPRTMKDFIGMKLREGRFSTPSEYTRSLIRDDQDLNGKSAFAALSLRSAGRKTAMPSRLRLAGGRD